MLCCLLVSGLQAQPLDCEVIITPDPQLGSVLDNSVIATMQGAMESYLNTTNWSRDEFLPHERIACTISLTIQAVPSPANYQGIAQIVAARPVYGSTYQTPSFSYTDETWNFTYQQGEVLRYRNVGRLEELPALLAFYALLVLGTDYDSFELQSGTPYYTEAKEIVSRVASSGQGPWSQYGTFRSRYWLIDNISDAQLAPLRQVTYAYHRKGLDVLSTEKETAEKEIVAQLRTLQAVRAARPVVLWLTSFVDAKYGELIALCQEIEDASLRQESYDILRKLDPTRTDKYKKIITK